MIFSFYGGNSNDLLHISHRKNIYISRYVVCWYEESQEMDYQYHAKPEIFYFENSVDPDQLAS